MRLLALLASLAGWQIANAAVIRVRHNATGQNNGTSWLDAFVDLQSALAVAVAGDEVWVAAGVYRPAAAGGSLFATLLLPADVVMLGGFAGDEAAAAQRDPQAHPTILSGDLQGNDAPNFGNRTDNAIHVVTLAPNDVAGVLDGFTVRGGRANGLAVADRRGAGLLASGGTTRVRACVFTDNEASTGGGACCAAGGVRFERCEFKSNRGSMYGGGLLLTGAGQTQLIDCLIAENIGGRGAGCFNEGGSQPRFERCLFRANEGMIGSSSGAGFYERAMAVLIDCDFVQNSTGGGGGGLFVEATGQTKAVNTGFYGNEGLFDGGGAVYADGGQATLVNCVMSGNITSRASGTAVIAARGAQTHLINCTVYGNHDLNQPATALRAFSTGSVLSLTNSVVWSNGPTGSEAEQIQLGLTGTISVHHCLIQGWTGALGGTHNSGQNPLLRDPDGADGVIGTADDDYALRPGSPAIDSADNTVLPADEFDLDGDGDLAEPIPLAFNSEPRRLDEPTRGDTGAGTAPFADRGAYERRVDGDCDANGAVNLADYVLSADCLTGPDMPYAEGCACTDVELDGDTDLRDFAWIQANAKAP
jgi:hypothetical protein